MVLVKHSLHMTFNYLTEIYRRLRWASVRVSSFQPLATNNKQSASGNKSKTNTKNKRQTNKPKKQNSAPAVTVMLRQAPVSSHPRTRTRVNSKTKALANGHLIHSASTCVPITSPKSTDAITATGDLAPSNTTLFPNLANTCKGFDKIKWRKLQVRWTPTLPTTSGGTVGMYYDTDRTDVGATNMGLLSLNRNAVSSALWDRLHLNVDKKMLRSNEWFSTYKGASGNENTFVSPGRLHLHATSQPGITYTTETTIGYVWVTYEVELGFPSAPTDTTVPSRRAASSGRPTDFIVYNEDVVNRYRNFAAGCSPAPDFYQFVSLFTEEGELNESLAAAFDPDGESLSLRRPFGVPSANKFVQIRDRERNPFVSSASAADYAGFDEYDSHWRNESSQDSL